MIAAPAPRSIRESGRLLVVDARDETFYDSRVTDLPGLLHPGDLLVVNDAATLPASIRAHDAKGGTVEIRLLRHAGNSDWLAVLLGEGDWRTPTELRDAPAPVRAGQTLHIGRDFAADIRDISAISNYLVTLRFNRSGAGMWSGIYGYGRPIQYSYMTHELPLWAVQTVYGSRPWAVEMPSAGYGLNWAILLALKRRGVHVASVTHGAGLSAAGYEEIDGVLPMPERFAIPPATAAAVETALSENRTIIAVGTTVVRALEGCAAIHGGHVVAGTGETDLMLNRSFQPAVVDGLLTGVHDPSQSHFRLLHAFAGPNILRRAWRHAIASGYQCHEFGDSCLLLGATRLLAIYRTKSIRPT